jgi:vacuolar-type H+-ATPase subunit C/Vma6
MAAVAARARGLVTTVVSGDALTAIDRARDALELAAALARAGLTLPAGIGDPGTPDTIDRLAGTRVASDLAILARRTDALAVLALDEDRRSLRAIVRGLAAGVAADRRLMGTVPTETLPAPLLAALAGSTSVAELAALLARRRHPFATALASTRTPIDLLEIELALAQRFAEHPRPRDRALRTYLTQMIDAENTAAALLLAARGSDVELDHAFLAGGLRVDRGTFTTAAAGPLDMSRRRLATALARTPLAHALFAAEPAALEDAALAWQLATQLHLRRTEPLGLAPAVYLVLRRRDEARHLRRAAWRVALGAAA